MSDRTLILIAGVEGVGVTLCGEKTAAGWRFQRSYADQTPLMLEMHTCGRLRPAAASGAIGT